MHPTTRMQSDTRGPGGRAGVRAGTGSQGHRVKGIEAGAKTTVRGTGRFRGKSRNRLRGRCRGSRGWKRIRGTRGRRGRGVRKAYPEAMSHLRHHLGLFRAQLTQVAHPKQQPRNEGAQLQHQEHNLQNAQQHLMEVATCMVEKSSKSMVQMDKMKAAQHVDQAWNRISTCTEVHSKLGPMV